MNSLYEIINGKKYKKCKDNQIRNPITMKCNNIKENSLYEIINGKKYKKCKDNQIRNPITMRCNNIKPKQIKPKQIKPKQIKPKEIKPTQIKLKQIKHKEIKTNNLNSSSKKNIAARIIQKKFKKFIYPFINRVSGNINDRIIYYNNITRYIKIDKKNNNYCMRFYKYDINNQPIFRIGTDIILKNKIGSDSVYGIVYLSSFRDKLKKLYKFATKITYLSNEIKNEILLLKKVNKLTINNICPHFPIIYGILNCDDFMNFYNSYNNFNNSNSKIDNNYISNLNLYPEFIKKNYNKHLISIFNELANGDLKSFLLIYYHNNINFFNALAQIYISIMFFQFYTNYSHNDTHWGNFLYHKIKPGGYFHYKIYDKDYYIENIGFLWVIWDFGKSNKIIIKDIYDSYLIKSDFKRIINAFTYTYNSFNNYFRGWINFSDKEFYNGNDVLKFKNDFIKSINNDYVITINKIYYDIFDNFIIPIDTNPSANNIKKVFYNNILDTLVRYNIIFNTIDKNANIINKKPFIIA